MASHTVTILSIALCAPLAWAQACFDNTQLALVQQETKALLYVWSPRMVLSAYEAASVRQQARAQGLRFVPLHDPQVPSEEITAAFNRMVSSGVTALINSASDLKNSEPLCASALLERDALRHFSTAFVLLPKGLSGFPIVGAMPASAWSLSLQQRLLLPTITALPAAQTTP